MAWFSGSHEETFTVDVPFEEAKRHFADLDNIVACYAELERSEKLDDKTLRLQLEPKSALGATFVGKYDCRYEFKEDNRLSWETVNPDATIKATGWAEFSPVGEGKTKVTYHESMDCDIPINRLLAKALKPIVERDIANGVKGYIKRMRGSI